MGRAEYAALDSPFKTGSQFLSGAKAGIIRPPLVMPWCGQAVVKDEIAIENEIEKAGITILLICIPQCRCTAVVHRREDSC